MTYSYDTIWLNPNGTIDDISIQFELVGELDFRIKNITRRGCDRDIQNIIQEAGYYDAYCRRVEFHICGMDEVDKLF